MNLSNAKGSMNTSTSSWKSNDVVSEQFPAGLRVLVVDDDPTCLMILEKMLRTCRYEVTKCSRAEHALSLLRENKNGFDIVISDVHMPDMDGFKLLEHIGLEMDLPVIMMSADDCMKVVMKGVTHGACDYLIKPVRIEALKNIWQHMVRKKKNEWRELEQSGSVEDGDNQHHHNHNHHNRSAKPNDHDADYSSSVNEDNWKSPTSSSKKRKDDDDECDGEGDERDDASALKKPRVVWSVELHQQFVAAVNQLSIDKAVPKKILELMNVPGLTRENVASHLQKYRLYLRRLSGQHNPGMNNSFMGPQDSSFGPMTSLNGIDLQTLAVTGQLPVQSLATLQAVGLGRPSTPTLKSGLPLPLVDQRNLFSFENPKLRFGDPQQQAQPQSQLQKPLNLLHGIPTSMEPKQLTNLHHQSAQSIGMNLPTTQNSQLLVQTSQSQPRPQITSSSSINQPIVSSGVVGTGRGGPGYNPILHNPNSMMNFPISHQTSSDLPGNSFPLTTSPSISGISSSKSPFHHDEVNANIKGSVGFVPSYDIFNDLNQHNKPGDWDIPNVGLPFDQHSNGIQSGGGTLDLVHQGFSRNVHARNLPNNRGSQNIVIPQQNVNAIAMIDNNSSVRIKTERVPDMMINQTGGFYPDQFGQDDLMSALLKQQQEGIAQNETQFDFDGYSMDNIPV